MNWEVLRQAKNLLCRTAVNFLFFGIMFLYWDEFNYLGYIGGTIGGFLLSLAAFPTIFTQEKMDERTRGWWIIWVLLDHIFSILFIVIVQPQIDNLFII